MSILLAFSLRAETPASSTTPAQPNIILILADDLGYGSLGCYGAADVSTPNIDRLAAEGMRFTDFHGNGPLCTPTRASLLTGRYQQRCAWVPDSELSPVFQEQRRKNPAQRWAWGIASSELTLPEVLRPAGYRSGLVGKWHLGYDAKFHPMNQGFDEFHGFVGGSVDYHTHIAEYGQNQLDWWDGRELRDEPGYSTDLLTRHAANFIEKNSGKPFFLFLAHGAAHDPWQGRDPKAKKSPVETYREMIRTLDDSVGVISETLRKQKLETKTLLLFASDNGAAAPKAITTANAPLKGRKGSMFEGGHRVPFIAVWPSVIPPASTNSSTVMTMDLLPTLASLARATLPQGHTMDGRDLLPLLRGGSFPGERVLHWQNGDTWAVRRGPWKLVSEGGKPLALHDLEKDLGEKENLLTANSPLAAELLQLHQNWLNEVGSK